MIFEQLHIGGDKNLAYIFGDAATRQVAAVDPGCNPRMLIDRIAALGAQCVLILATHSHHDHIEGVDELKRATAAPFAGHPNIWGVDRPLADGERFSIGSVPVRIVHCPGHCGDSILIILNEQKVLVGDELFIGGVGITRSESQARLHHANLHAKLQALPDEMEVYPGHDYGAKPSSTLGEQRRTNPYLLQKNFESFWRLRQNWKTYVKEKGIKWG